MNPTTQLLCSFTTSEFLEKTLRQIQHNYDVAFDTIYVLENIDAPTTLCCTYNIFTASAIGDSIPDATISLHRKKATNTLYTINALNLLVESLNGERDRNFQIDWNDYRNSILVTAYGKLKRINTRLNHIVKLSELT